MCGPIVLKFQGPSEHGSLAGAARQAALALPLQVQPDIRRSVLYPSGNCHTGTQPAILLGVMQAHRKMFVNSCEHRIAVHSTLESRQHSFFLHVGFITRTYRTLVAYCQTHQIRHIKYISLVSVSTVHHFFDCLGRECNLQCLGEDLFVVS